MKKAFAVLAATGMLALAGTAGSASAATTTPGMATIQALVNRVDHAPNPKAAFNKLSSADKKLFMATIQALVNRVDHAPNPKAAFNKLSSADKKLFREATTPYGAPKILGAKIPQSMMNPAYSGCWGHFDKVEDQNFLGWVLKDGYQMTHICASNGSVSNVWVDNVDGNGAWGWHWDSGGSATTTFNAGWEGRGAVNFAYDDNVGDHAYMCLRIFVNSNGYNWRIDHTCPAAA